MPTGVGDDDETRTLAATTIFTPTLGLFAWAAFTKEAYWSGTILLLLSLMFALPSIALAFKGRRR